MTSGFVILCSDEASLLERSLPLALGEAFDEGLVIDNASSDATADVARRLGVETLRLERRVPYTEAMNAGLRRMPADAVALLQADTFITPGYRTACLRALEDPRVGSVAPKLLRATSDGNEDPSEQIDAAGMWIDRRRKNGLVGHGQRRGAFAQAGEAFGADGAAAFYRRETLYDCEVLGEVFDENMPGWACDADLAWRARLLGWRSWYQPEAVVLHVRTYSPSTRSRLEVADRRVQFRNRYLMIAKNDSVSELLRDAGPLLLYELLAFGYAFVREPGLLRGYLEALNRLPGAIRRRRIIQARRRVTRVPFGMLPPP
jgi:GT2 family glycosyltransferase